MIIRVHGVFPCYKLQIYMGYLYTRTCEDSPAYALAPDVVVVALEPIWKLTPRGRVPVSPFALIAPNAVTCTDQVT